MKKQLQIFIDEESGEIFYSPDRGQSFFAAHPEKEAQAIAQIGSPGELVVIGENGALEGSGFKVLNAPCDLSKSNPGVLMSFNCLRGILRKLIKEKK